MSDEGGRVLLVDEDVHSIENLATLLRDRGHEVGIAADGLAGLDLGIDMAAEVVVVDGALVGVDLRSFIEVLLENPRTSDATFFVMRRRDQAGHGAFADRAELLIKPFHPTEFATRIDEVIRSRRAPDKEPELKGDIAQVALFDLIQVFALNRRTGTLTVETSSGAGSLSMSQGQIVDAVEGRTTGEKAVFRLLAAREGRFTFTPGLEKKVHRVDASTDQILMEAVRRIDERQQLISDMPPPDALFQLCGDKPSEPGVARDVAEALVSPSALEDVLDRVDSNDLEILQAVKGLLQDGSVAVVAKGGERVSLVDEDHAVLLRTAALQLRRPGIEGPVRVGVAGSAADLRRFARAVSKILEFRHRADRIVGLGDGLLGSLGALRIGAFELELFVLPLDPTLRPFWGAFLPQAKALLLVGKRADEELQRTFGALDVLVSEASGAWSEPAGAAAAIRALLARAVGR